MTSVALDNLCVCPLRAEFVQSRSSNATSFVVARRQRKENHTRLLHYPRRGGVAVMVPWKFNPAQEKLFGVQSALLYATVRFIINSTVVRTYHRYLRIYLGTLG